MEAAERLDHENIVRLFGSRRGRTTACVRMEGLETRRLAALLDERGKLTWAQALPIALGLLSALAHAHRQGVPHLGVGPRNILLPRLDATKLGDFGLASALGRAAGDAPAGPLMTQDYAAPEVRQAEGGDAQSDVYAAGGVLYRMLTGELPRGPESARRRGRPDPARAGGAAGGGGTCALPTARERRGPSRSPFRGGEGAGYGGDARGAKGVVRAQEQPAASLQPRTPAPAQAPEAASPQPAVAPLDLAAPPVGDAAPPIGPGTRLGRYVLGRRLGEGAKGEVYEAQDEDLKRRVAVKIMRPDARFHEKVPSPLGQLDSSVRKLVAQSPRASERIVALQRFKDGAQLRILLANGINALP
ncbi:MAG: protein kinase [Planctomycetes bacterium]|nr:protein kinase [Planctomycetota bacterium]